MININKLFLKIFCATLCLGSIQILAAEKMEKVVLLADTWCPYNCTPGTNEPGLMIEVAQKAFGKENVTYQLMPWKRAIAEARAGNADGIVGAAISDAPDFLMATTLSKSINCFYTNKKDTWTYAGHDSIKGKKLGTISAYSYPDFIISYISDKNYNQNVEISGDGVLTNLLKMVDLGRIDITTDDQNVLQYLLDSNPELQSKVKNAGCADGSADVPEISIAFAPKFQTKSVKLVKTLNETIRSMITSGEMDALVKKYKMQKWW